MKSKLLVVLTVFTLFGCNNINNDSFYSENTSSDEVHSITSEENKHKINFVVEEWLVNTKNCIEINCSEAKFIYNEEQFNLYTIEYVENSEIVVYENVKFNSYKEIGCWEATHWSSSRCSQVNYLINNNNTLTVINGNKYLIYDENMKEIYRSDEYDQIYLIKDYVITIKDIKMYIFDLSGKIVKEFKLINEDSEIITGVLHDKNDIEIFKIAIGDNYYYYIPSTGESGIKLLEY